MSIITYTIEDDKYLEIIKNEIDVPTEEEIQNIKSLISEVENEPDIITLPNDTKEIRLKQLNEQLNIMLETRSKFGL
jgi:hypothetical protein